MTTEETSGGVARRWREDARLEALSRLSSFWRSTTGKRSSRSTRYEILLSSDAREIPAEGAGRRDQDPIVRIDQKYVKGVHLRDLADYIEERRRIGIRELGQLASAESSLK